MKTGKIIAGSLIAAGAGAVVFFGFIKKFDGVTGWKKLMGKFKKKEDASKEEGSKEEIKTPPKEEKKQPPPQPLLDWKKGDVLYAVTDLNFYKKPDATEENRLGTIKKLNSVGRFDSINTTNAAGWTKLIITRRKSKNVWKDKSKPEYETSPAYVQTNELTNKTF